MTIDTQKNTIAPDRNQPSQPFFDAFTRTMLAIMCALLLFIFVSARYMSAHEMEAAGTDDHVNRMAAQLVHREHHPFINLPGDAQIGAFSVANFFAGIIIGYHWLRLFGQKQKPGQQPDEQ
jgi:cobalt/nickel transport protein